MNYIAVVPTSNGEMADSEDPPPLLFFHVIKEKNVIMVVNVMITKSKQAAEHIHLGNVYLH